MKFNSFNDLKKHFVEPDIFLMLDNIFKKNSIQENMIEFNHNQLWAGIDSNEKRIKTLASIGSSVYSLYTIKIKQSKGQTTKNATLFDTGQFHKSFKVRILSNGYEIIADYQKADGDIRDNFACDYDFLGLTYTTLFEFVYEFIYPELSKIIRKQYLDK